MSKEENAPIEKLFGSKTRAKLLGLFFSDVNKSYYVREITRTISEQINSVRRELINLENVGVVKSETYDNKVYYSANMKNQYAHAFQEIFSPRKAMSANGPAGPRLSNVNAVTKIAPVDSAVEVRRVVRPNNNWEENIRPVEKYLKALIVTHRDFDQEGVDMLIVGDDQTKKLTRWAEVVERKHGKPMNYVIMSRDDYLYRKSVKDKFLMKLMEMEITEIYDPGGIVRGEAD